MVDILYWIAFFFSRQPSLLLISSFSHFRGQNTHFANKVARVFGLKRDTLSCLTSKVFALATYVARRDRLDSFRCKNSRQRSRQKMREKMLKVTAKKSNESWEIFDECSIILRATLRRVKRNALPLFRHRRISYTSLRIRVQLDGKFEFISKALLAIIWSSFLFPESTMASVMGG